MGFYKGNSINLWMETKWYKKTNSENSSSSYVTGAGEIITSGDSISLGKALLTASESENVSIMQQASSLGFGHIDEYQGLRELADFFRRGEFRIYTNA